MDSNEKKVYTPEQQWDDIQEDAAWLEGQKEKFKDNPEVTAKIMRYLEQIDGRLQMILDRLDGEDVLAKNPERKGREVQEMHFSELGSAAAKAAESKEYYVDGQGFMHGRREDAIGNRDDNRGASMGRAS